MVDRVIRDVPKDYKPYPAYKPSGVEWLGEIPTHWVVLRLKYAATLNPNVSEVRRLVQDTEVSFVPMEAVGEYGGLDLSQTRQLADVASGYTYFSEGDVLIAKITPCFENGKGSLAEGLLNGTAFGTTELHVIRCGPGLDKEFAFYLTLSNAFRKLGEAEMYGAGGQKRVPESFVEDLKHALPLLPEQRAIAAFLDRETAKIDSLVAKKERMIELLDEKRSALISWVVTKGLDPNVPMKDSGVEWLGETPVHWDVKRLKHLLRAPLQYGANEPSNHIDPDSPRYIRITDIREDGTLWDETFRSIPQEVAEPYLLAEGDLLFARSGATVGKTFKYRPRWGKAAYAGYLVRARLDDHLTESDFVEYYTHSQEYKDWILSNLIQSTIQNVSAERYASLVVPLPPLVEQRAISKHLDSETAKLNPLMATVREGIARLQELRSALISAAVTGRIDVRGEAA